MGNIFLSALVRIIAIVAIFVAFDWWLAVALIVLNMIKPVYYWGDRLDYGSSRTAIRLIAELALYIIGGMAIHHLDSSHIWLALWVAAAILPIWSNLNRVSRY